MRVLFLTRAPFISGAEKSMLLTTLALRDCGVDSLILCPQQAPIVDWCEKNKIAWISWPRYCFELSNTLNIRWLVPGKLGGLKNKHIDLLHCNQVWNNRLAVAVGKQLDVPVICHMRDYTTCQGLRWFLANAPRAIISVSQHLESYLRVQGLARNILVTTLIGPVSVPPYKLLNHGEDRRKRLCRILNIPSGTRLLLFAGQLIHQKGIAILCDALTRLGNLAARVIGVGVTPDQWQRLGEPWRRILCNLQERGLLRLVPSMDDISVFYSSVDLVILPSLEEPLGRVILEAASWGVPSIVTATDGLSETVIPHVTGWQTRAGDPDALVETIKAALELPLAEYGLRARSFVERYYSAEVYAQRLLVFYKTVLDSISTPRSEYERHAQA